MSENDMNTYGQHNDHERTQNFNGKWKLGYMERNKRMCRVVMVTQVRVMQLSNEMMCKV